MSDTDACLEYADLFGQLSYANSDWCASIVGPSAYLVFLLDWVHRLDGTVVHAADGDGNTYGDYLAQLVLRRPDLVTLELTCDNTNRLLPYIDLVMEVLENAVAPSGATAHDTTDAESDDLVAAPQYVNDEAYTTLGASVFPLCLPFDLSLERARRYGGHLGLSRSVLMEALQDSPAPPAPSARERAIERLATDATVAAIAVGTDANSVAALWGYVDVAAPACWAELKVQAEFRKRTGLDPDGVLDLIHVRYTNALGTIELYDAASEDPDEWTLRSSSATPTEAQFAAILRFLRLWRVTGWTMLELDKVATAFGWSSFGGQVAVTGDDDVIPTVAWIERLRGEVGLDIAELASWWGTIDTYEDRDTARAPVLCLFDRVFLDPSVYPTTTTSAHPFALNDERTELAVYLAGGIGADLKAYWTPLQMALGLNDVDMAAAWAWLDEGDGDHITVGVDVYVAATLANLSRLFRLASAARAVSLPVADALSLIALADVSPFASNASITAPERAWTFVRRAGEVRASGLTWDEVRWMLTSDAEAATRAAPGDDHWLGEQLGNLRDRLAKLRSSLNAEPDDTGARTLELLDALPFPVSNPSAYPTEDFYELIRQLLAQNIGGMTEGDQATLLSDFFGEYLDQTEAVATLVAAATKRIDQPARYAWVFGQLAYRVQGQVAISEFFASVLKSRTSVMDALRRVVFSGAPNADYALPFLSEDFTGEIADVDGPNPTGEMNVALVGVESYACSVDRLARAVRLIETLELSDPEVDWLADVSSGATNPLNVLDLATLADRTFAPTAATAFAQLRELLRLVAQRPRLPGEAPTFASLMGTLGEATASEFATELATRTGWDGTLLSELADLPEAGLGSADRLSRYLDAIELARSAGASATQLVAWSAASVSSDVADDIVGTTRARYATASEWKAVAHPLRDTLRIRQRRALMDYLIHTQVEIADAADLYGYYLLDPEMGPWLMTSRVKQAALSVQLFVYRMLLGLEADPAFLTVATDLTQDKREEWEWVKTYRLWEAGRRVFLYPENWIDPDLRDDKSPFFHALESSLRQGEFTEERVEEAVLGYLDSLRDVSNLKVVGMYHQYEVQTDDDGLPLNTTDLLHVFARSRTLPPNFFYRRWENQATWTAWEKVDVDVEGDYIVPVVTQGRLLLFWALLEPQHEGDATDEAARFTWFKIGLAWSEYRGGSFRPHGVTGLPRSKRQEGRWSTKRTATVPIDTEELAMGNASWKVEDQIDATRFVFQPEITTEESAAGAIEVLRIWAYYEPGDDVTTSGTASLRATGYFEVDLGSQEVVTTDYTSPLIPSFFPQEPHVRTVPVGGQADRGTLRLGSGAELRLPYAQVDDPADANFGDLLTYLVLNTLGLEASVTVLAQQPDFMSQAPLFVQDSRRAFLVVPSNDWNGEVDAQGEAENPVVGAPSTSTTGDGEEPAGVIIICGGGPGRITGPALSEVLADPEEMVLFSGTPPSDFDRLFLAVDAAMGPTGLSPLTPCIYDFQAFYHPFVGTFIQAVRQNGLMGLFAPTWEAAGGLARQDLGAEAESTFFADYGPTIHVNTEPEEVVDFAQEGAYSLYNWELFYFVPLLIAMRLDSDRQFADAQVWFSTVFDPTDKTTDLDSVDGVESPWRKYWKVKPLMEPPGDAVTDWLSFTSDDEAAAAFQAQVDAWLAEPFNPHALARIRPGVYQRWTFMRYIEHLLAWGDDLFARDTLESLNEATQLYMVAKQLLGTRPVLADRPERPSPMSFGDLFTGLDAFDNALNTVLNHMAGPSTAPSASSMRPTIGIALSLSTVMSVAGSYFSVPFNDKLLACWDTVADRLFKIRNGMNLDGQERQLPLFEPPIDPGMLVRAAASGMDLGTILTGLSARRPPYRFNAMLQRAQAATGSVKAFGSALLAALEKQDGEALGRLRQDQEIEGIGDQIQQRRLQVEEATQAVESATLSLTATRARQHYYDNLVKKGLLEGEHLAQRQQLQAQAITEEAEQTQTMATISSLIPQIAIGTANYVEFGGAQLSTLIGFQVSALNNKAGRLRFDADRNRTAADQARRAADWAFQRDSAEREGKQLEVQIRSARKRLDIANGELGNAKKQADRAKTVEGFLRTKYTNAELFDWTVEQLSAGYYQAYRLAFDAAKQAELCHQFELGRSGESFIQYGYWDGSRRGLYSGERLGHDLERLETAHLLNDTREYELTKSVSLSQLDPASVILLREKGTCYFQIPEAVFDADCPGHYFRRLQGVTLTTLCVGGPQGGIHLKLTLVSAQTRISIADPTGYAESPTGEDTRFAYDTTSTEAIVTSQAQDDSGVFSADPKDPRYLPFERRGAISTWKLENIEAITSFDLSTLVDVVLRLRYTARDGGSTLASNAGAAVLAGLNASVGGWTSSTTSTVTDLQRAFSCAREFPDEWYAFQQTETETGDQILTLELSNELLPIGHRDHTVAVTAIHVFFVGVSAARWAAEEDMKLKLNSTNALEFGRTSAWGNLPHAVSTAVTSLASTTISFDPADYEVTASAAPALVNTTPTPDRLRTTEIDDMIVLVTYTLA